MNNKTAKLYCITSLFSLFVVMANAQGNAFTKSWSATWRPSKVFIKNKGQFKLPASSAINSEVAFVYDEGATKIFFTQKGLVYSFSQKQKKTSKKKSIQKNLKTKKIF